MRWRLFFVVLFRGRFLLDLDGMMMICNLVKIHQDDPTIPIQIVSPFEPDCEAFFLFDEMGKIHAKNGVERASISIGFLGLDARALNLLRETAILEYFKNLPDEEDISTEIAKLGQKANGKFEPFCTAIISVLGNYP